MATAADNNRNANGPVSGDAISTAARKDNAAAQDSSTTRTSDAAQTALASLNKDQKASRKSCCARFWLFILSPFTCMMNAIRWCWKSIFDEENTIPNRPPRPSVPQPLPPPIPNPAPPQPGLGSTPALPTSVKQLRDGVNKLKTELGSVQADIKQASQKKEIESLEKLYFAQQRILKLQAEKAKKETELQKQEESVKQEKQKTGLNAAQVKLLDETTRTVESARKTYDEFCKTIATAETDCQQGLDGNKTAILAAFEGEQKDLNERLADDQLEHTPADSDDFASYNTYLSHYDLLRKLAWVEEDDPTHAQILEKRSKLSNAVGLMNRLGLLSSSTANLRNVCWMNSAIQALHGIPEISQKLKSELETLEKLSSSGNLSGEAETRHRLLMAVQNLFNAIESGDGKELEERSGELEEEIFKQRDDFDPTRRGKEQDGAAFVDLVMERLGFSFKTKITRIEIQDQAAIKAGTAPQVGDSEDTGTVLKIPFVEGISHVVNLIGDMYDRQVDANETPWKRGVKKYTFTERLENLPTLFAIQFKRNLTFDPLATVADNQKKLTKEQVEAAKTKDDKEKLEKEAPKKIREAQDERVKKFAEEFKQLFAKQKAAFEAIFEKSSLDPLFKQHFDLTSIPEVGQDAAKKMARALQDAIQKTIKSLTEVNNNIKLDRRVEFDGDELDLTDFCSEEAKEQAEKLTENGRALYKICSFTVHRGSGSEGHYFAYRRDKVTGQWRKYDDMKVENVTEEEALEALPLANNVFLELIQKQTAEE